MKRGIIAVFIFAFLFLALPFSLSASVNNNLPVQIQSTNNNGNIVTGTFNYTVNISNSVSNTCDSSNIVYSNETTRTTDNRGIVSYQLKDVNLDFDEQYWFCYYREGNLEDTVKMGSTPYAFSAEGLRTSEGLIQNVSDINGSDINNDFNWINSSQDSNTNNYSDEISFSGTNTKTLDLSRVGLSNLTASFNDQYEADTNLSGVSSSSSSLSNSFPDIAVNWNDATDLNSGGDLATDSVQTNELDDSKSYSLSWSNLDISQSDVSASDVGLGNVRNVDLDNTDGNALNYDANNDNFDVQESNIQTTKLDNDAGFITNPDDNVESGELDDGSSLSFSGDTLDVNWNDATDLTTNGDLGSSTVSDSELSVNVEGISTGLSSGSIAFSDGSTLSGENSNLYWDSSNDRLGIGTSSPSSNLDVDGSAQFGGTWENGGAEIQDGDVYAQTGYFYNISSLNVSTLSVNGSQIPQLDDTFVLGNSTNRWKSANVGTGGINSTGTIRQGGNQVLDTSTSWSGDLSGSGTSPSVNWNDATDLNSGGDLGSDVVQSNELDETDSYSLDWSNLGISQSDVSASDVGLSDVRNVDLDNADGNALNYDTNNDNFDVQEGNIQTTNLDNDAGFISNADDNVESGELDDGSSLSFSGDTLNVDWNDATDLTTNGDLGSSTVSDSELSVNVEGISTGLSSGSIAFSDGSTLSGENSNLYWDSSNDRLGIGSSSPTSSLQVGDGSGSETISFDTDLTDNASIDFANGGTVYSRIVEDSNQDMVFETNNNGVSDNKDFIWNDSESRVMTLRGEGMLGIGTHFPEEELEVIGQINASDDICITGGNCLSSVSGGGGFDGVNSNYLFNNSGNIDFNETYLDNNVEWTSSGSKIYPNSLSKGVGVRTDSLNSQAFAVNTSGTQKGVSLGKNLTPSGKHSLSTGIFSESSGANSLATGYDNYASGFASFAGGRFTEVSGDDSFGYGDGVKVDGLDSFATGLNSSAAGNRAFAAGSFANASGRTSVALGSTTVASATNSVALGGGTASGIGSFVSGGPLTEASGQNSFALGEEVDAKGKNSFALGNDIVSSGNYSFAIGLSESKNPHPDINQSNTMAVMGGRLSVDQTLPYSRFDVNGSVSKEIRRPRDTQTIYIGNYDTYALRVSAQSISRAVILPPPDRAEDREYAIIRTDAATSGNNINVDVPEEFRYSINGGPIELERAYSSVKLMADEKTDKWYIVSSYRYP